MECGADRSGDDRSHLRVPPLGDHQLMMLESNSGTATSSRSHLQTLSSLSTTTSICSKWLSVSQTISLVLAYLLYLRCSR